MNTVGLSNMPAENNIVFHAGGDSGEMLRITNEGFYVRGVRVPQDEREAETVYNTFRAWMAWSLLNER